MTASPQLSGKTAVVTGASSGIGAAIAVALAEQGAEVVLHYRANRTGAERTAERLAELKVNCLLIAADLAEPAEQDRLVEEAWQWRGGIDSWVNNAGADVLTGDAAGWSFERKLEEIWRVDVTATMRLSRAVGRSMSQRNDGGDCSIVNIGWDQAWQGMAGDSGEMFAASKGAIMSFSRSLAQSLAPRVRVNCVAPGWIQTAWGAQASDKWHDRVVAESLQRRWGSPEDVAAAVAFLVSPQASYINGHVLPVNGGFRYGPSSSSASS